MNCFSVLIKVKDFLPKINKIPFDNFICIFTHEEFEGRISLMQHEYQYINHEIKDINSDIKYKITMIDCVTKKLIGTCYYFIPHNKIKNLNIGNSINFTSIIKVLISQKTKKQFLENTKDNIFLTISTEIIKFNKFSCDLNSSTQNKFENKNISSKINKYYQESNSEDKNSIKHPHIKNIKKNPFEYIKIKKVNSNKLMADINEESQNLMNNSKSNRDYRRNKNELEMLYKRYASPLLSGDSKKNINLNMHNICVQNYYTITSPPEIKNENELMVKDNNFEFNENKIYSKKSLKCNKINNKKNIVNNKLDRSKANNRLENQNFLFSKNIKNNDYLKKEIFLKNKNKTKDKEKISQNYLTKFKHKENDKKNESLTNKISSIIITKKNKNKNKKNNIINDKQFKNYSSVDKIQNKTRHNFNKITKIVNLFRSSTIYSKKNNVIKSKKPLATNLSKYINSTDNLNYNITLNSSSFTNKYNKKYKLEKFDNLIFTKSYTLRENTNILNKKLYNSNNNLISKIKPNNSTNKSFPKYIGENKDKNFTNDIKKKIILENDLQFKFAQLIKLNISLYKKLKKLKNAYKNAQMKYCLLKERNINLVQKKNIIKQRINANEINNYIHVKINCRINNKVIQKIKEVKEKEISIYQNIFNISINNNDIFNQLTNDQIIKEKENRELFLFLILTKNLINKYGNITQIFNDNLNKKKNLLLLLMNYDIEIKDHNFLYLDLKNVKEKKREINNKYCKEIKEEIEEEEENDDNDDEEEKKLNISIVYKNKSNILDKILINDFPLKYSNITDKKFKKLGASEYIFNNDIKVFAYYKEDEVFIQIDDDNSFDSYKDYTLDEFVSKYIKNKLNRKNNFISILDKSNIKKKKTRKSNICKEKYSRNHKIINDSEFNQEDFKKKFLNDKILFSNDSFLKYSSKENFSEIPNKEMEKSLEKNSFVNDWNIGDNIK